MPDGDTLHGSSTPVERARLAAAEHDIPDERVGQYARIEELGRGGQSVVWRAMDVFVGREVALKELRAPSPLAEGSSAPPVRDRFLREARLTAQLDHPGIVAVHELARRPDGTLFCAQKLIRGETLKARLAACETLADRLALLPHLIDACHAVAYAHARGVVHRDLKPSNVMVGAYGETVVVDWGLAKQRGEVEADGIIPTAGLAADLTATGVVLGTPAYMSPEQARGAVNEIDERSDVFSLGAILYELLTARRPFDGAAAEDVIASVLRGELRPVRDVCPEVPPELAAVAERALRHDARDRYPGAAPLATELVAYRSGGRVRAYEYGSWELLRKFAARHRALLVALIIGGAIAVGALIVSRATVARQLATTRLELASSFLERGYRAQREGDWSKAAAYFAAARAQHDTHEARWSLAVARERIAERIVSLEGPAESFVDAGVLADGRVVALEQSLDHVEVREAASGTPLWERSGEVVLAAAFAADGVLAVRHPGAWTFHDAATGRELSTWSDDAGVPCPGHYPPAAAIVDGALVRVEAGAPSQVLATDVQPGAPTGMGCAVAPDGDKAVYLDGAWRLRVLSLADGRELARRDSDDFKAVRFSRRHGLVIFRQGQLEVVGDPDGDADGDPDGDFTIDLPDSGVSRKMFLSIGDSLSGTGVSPDGDLAVIAGRHGNTEAMVVDLRSRSVRGVLHYAPGSPRFAFSPDGRDVYAAGMGNASLLSGWRLPPEDLPKTPRWWGFGRLFPGGNAALYWDASGTYELQGPVGTFVARGAIAFSALQLLGDGPLAAFIAPDASAVSLRDLTTDRPVWTHACRQCRDMSVSYDGSVFAFVDAHGLQVWDTRNDRLVFEEARRIRPNLALCAVSRDGRRIAWNQVDTAVVRELDSGREWTLPIDGPVRQVQFSPDPERLLTVTTRTTRVWNVAAGRPAWSRGADASSSEVLSRWSPERRALLLEYGYAATEVLDMDSGQRLGWFEALSRAVTPVQAEVYANDLRTKAVASAARWDYRAVPPPAAEPAAESLSQTLRRTGLELRGVELIAAP